MIAIEAGFLPMRCPASFMKKLHLGIDKYRTYEYN